MNMKMKGSIHFMRRYILQEKDLSDAEQRLLLIYRCVCDWDHKHANFFGSSDISLRELKNDFLPGWCIGKLSGVRNKLVEKGLLRRVGRTKFSILKPEIFYGKIKDIEQSFQLAEQSVQSEEQTVHLVEQKKALGRSLSMPSLTQSVHPAEQATGSKELLKKEKEPLKENSSSIWNEEGRINRLKEKIRQRNSGNSP